MGWGGGGVGGGGSGGHNSDHNIVIDVTIFGLLVRIYIYIESGK